VHGVLVVRCDRGEQRLIRNRLGAGLRTASCAEIARAHCMVAFPGVLSFAMSWPNAPAIGPAVARGAVTPNTSVARAGCLRCRRVSQEGEGERPVSTSRYVLPGHRRATPRPAGPSLQDTGVVPPGWAAPQGMPMTRAGCRSPGRRALRGGRPAQAGSVRCRYGAEEPIVVVAIRGGRADAPESIKGENSH
jgi:hypothetical protein